MGYGFQTTRWSLVLAAGEVGSPESREALAFLCEAYWYPVYAFVRRQNHDADGARDLTQAYFLVALEKNYLNDARPDVGRFRSFLLTSVKNFLSKERERSRALKRGGGHEVRSLDLTRAEERYAAELTTGTSSPEALFERRWALTVLERAMTRLQDEFNQSGKVELFRALQPHLTGEGRAVAYRELAQRLDSSEGAIKVAMYRSRRRFGELLRAEIAETVATSEEIDHEVRYLLKILQG